MSTRTTFILSLALVLLAAVLSAAVYARLPDPMASHWDIHDEVNGFIPRFSGAFLMPVIALAMLGLFLLLPAIDPLKANIARFRPVFNTFILLLVGFLFYVHLLTLLWNLGYQGFRMSQALLPAIGLILIFAGILIRHARRNFFIGIRTPWTLSSDRVWDQTHRVGWVLFVLCGALAFFGGFFPGPIAFVIILLPMLLSSTFLIGYSYVLYQRESKS